MLNYEDLYNELMPLEKSLKDCVGSMTRFQKTVAKETENGNLPEVKKALAALAENVKQMQTKVQETYEAAERFDTKEYFISGDFTKQLLESCGQKGIDVRGEMGVYEMFPYKIRITGDEEHTEEVYINRKKIPSFRPSFIAETIRAGQEKLFKGGFNAQSFMTELAEGYEMSCLKSGARIESTQMLDKIYKVMAPVSRARKEYDKQAFAFDLARLYEAGPESWATKSGRRFYFGTSRDGKSGIRVLSSSGVETYINTLKPVEEG